MSEIKIPADHFIADHPGSEPPLRPTPSVQKPAKAEKFDLQDVLIVLGFAAVVGGVTAIYFPAGLIVAGLMLGGSALLIEKSKNPHRSMKVRKRKKGDEE